MSGYTVTVYSAKAQGTSPGHMWYKYYYYGDSAFNFRSALIRIKELSSPQFVMKCIKLRTARRAMMKRYRALNALSP